MSAEEDFGACGFSPTVSFAGNSLKEGAKRHGTQAAPYASVGARIARPTMRCIDRFSQKCPAAGRTDCHAALRLAMTGTEDRP